MQTSETIPSQPVQVISSGSIAAVHGSAHDEGSSQTDFLQIESIVLNLDASLRVHARAHFFSWTQGLLQSLIRHELLICTLCHGKPPAFRADGFSMTSPDPSLVSDMFMRDTSVAPALLKAWEERRYQPVAFEVGTAAGWKKVTASAAAPSGATTATVRLYDDQNSTGTTTWDDVVLRSSLDSAYAEAVGYV